MYKFVRHGNVVKIDQTNSTYVHSIDAMSQAGHASCSENVKREQLKIDNEEFKLRKRLPPRYPVRTNDVYVNNQTNFKGQLSRCLKLLEEEDTVYIHGLGSAISKAINLALRLQAEAVVPLQVAANTSTVRLTGT